MFRTYIKVLVLISLVIIISSCSNDSSPNASPTNTPLPLTPVPTHHPISAPASTPTPSLQDLSKTPLGKTISFDINSGIIHLHIDSYSGFYCNMGTLAALDPNGPGELILKKQPSTYTPDEIDQITTYIQTEPKWKNPQNLPNQLLQWVSVGPTCSGSVQVSNLSSSAIQMQTLDMRLTAPIKEDQQTYNFIDFCSIPDACPGERAGGGITFYDFKLGGGDTGTVFTPQVDRLAKGILNSQGGLVLTPNGEEEITATFTSTFSVSPTTNLTYSILPELVLNTTRGQQIIELNQLATKLYIVKESQMPCYYRGGYVFELSLDDSVKANGQVSQQKQWCE